MDDVKRTEFALDLLVEGDFAVGAKNDLSEETDHARLFVGEATGDEREDRFGKQAVDVGWSCEGAGGFGEFGGDEGLR